MEGMAEFKHRKCPDSLIPAIFLVKRQEQVLIAASVGNTSEEKGKVRFEKNNIFINRNIINRRQSVNQLRSHIEHPGYK
jgi:hypothetical protein